MVLVHLCPLIQTTVLSISSMSPWRQFLPSTAEMEAISAWVSGVFLEGQRVHTAGTKRVDLWGEEEEKNAKDEEGVEAKVSHDGVDTMIDEVGVSVNK